MIRLNVFVILFVLVPRSGKANRCSFCGYGTVCDGRRCSCRDGFEGKRWSSGQRSFVCTDINECVSGAHRCLTGTRCVNSDGTYDCRCRSGWHGPWVTAHGQFICTEKSLCDSVYHRCGTGTYCLASNTTSYRCVCSLGFSSRTISEVDEIYTCSDIDECRKSRAKGPVCGKNSLCTNTLGSFRCKCVNGFRSAWKDNINCNIKVATQQSVAAQSFDVHKIGLAVGVSVVVLGLTLLILCVLHKRKKRSRKCSVKRLYHKNGQPIKISVLTGRESSYVNVILTSQEDKNSPDNGILGEKVEDAKQKGHIYSNEIELEVNLAKDQSNFRKTNTLPSLESGYVNHDTIKKARRSLSHNGTARCKINIRRPFSDSSVRVSGISDELQHKFSLLRKKNDGDFEKLPASRGDYDRLQRGSTVSPRPSVDKRAEHIYASPDPEDTEDDLSASGSVFDIYQPVPDDIVTDSTSLMDIEASTIYEPVIYSIPNKPPKQERIYANDIPKCDQLLGPLAVD
ncbi:multiple epidermal growth factor-like domains protein 10 [Liolophura sinensis]|uniref:multiple epidermal growth factor-like domains protein 10 n=1 Tax=Liolophura sinensis TaxID=3198878 RepID=UPI0031595B25